MTTGITVALAWNLPDKPTYPEHVYNERIENGSSVNQMVQNKNDANSNITRPTYSKLSKSDVVNRIVNYAEYYFRNRRPDSYYFGRNSSFFNPCNNRSCENHAYTNYYDLNDNKDGHNRETSVIRPPYSTSALYSANPSNDPMYMIETYFKPWIESSLNRIKSLEIPSKSA